MWRSVGCRFTMHSFIITTTDFPPLDMYVKQIWILDPGPEFAVIDVESGCILGIRIWKVLALFVEHSKWSNPCLLIQSQV